ncbi:protein phosphatase 2C domain-containing protein [Amphibacillus sp. Q70]|uniref:protein phosphatase 2C domain-containing protein n=1 Tax=Amphibacillus sp. Q70 TaxID=3453416 RepID=UPI003F84B6D5
MKIIDFFNDRGNQCKEDRLGFGDNYMFVLDGATGIAANQIPDYLSDTVWFVETATQFLNDKLSTEPDKKTKDILIEFSKHMNDQFHALDIGDIDKFALPSAAFIMARKVGHQLEIVSIGDCTGVIEFHSGEYKVIHDNRVTELDNRVIDAMKRIKEQQNISLIETKPFVKDLLKENRLLKNKPNGYQVLDFSNIALESSIYEKYPYDEIKTICLFSDGVDSYFTDFKISDGPIGLLKDIEEQGIHRILDRLRIEEETDPYCDHYPRLKMKDDATLIWANGERD